MVIHLPLFIMLMGILLLYRFITICLFIHQLMDIQLVDMKNESVIVVYQFSPGIEAFYPVGR